MGHFCLPSPPAVCKSPALCPYFVKKHAHLPGTSPPCEASPCCLGARAFPGPLSPQAGLPGQPAPTATAPLGVPCPLLPSSFLTPLAEAGPRVWPPHGLSPASCSLARLWLPHTAEEWAPVGSAPSAPAWGWESSGG